MDDLDVCLAPKTVAQGAGLSRLQRARKGIDHRRTRFTNHRPVLAHVRERQVRIVARAARGSDRRRHQVGVVWHLQVALCDRYRGLRLSGAKVTDGRKEP